jgi:small conductance mechanosensitive channel
MKILQITPGDSLNVSPKFAEIVETFKNTPTDVLFGDLMNKIVDLGLKVIAAIFLYFIGIWVIRRIKNILGRIFERKNTEAAIVSFVQSFASITLTIILVIIIVGTLGIDTTSIAALLTGGGVAIGLALNGTMQNFAGGLMLLIFRPFKAGDYIHTKNTEGTVSEVNITSTKLTTTDNRVIIIPNGLLSNDTIINFSQNTMRRLDITIDVEYGTSVDHTKAILADIIAKEERILNLSTGAPADPVIALSSLAASSVQFVIKVWVKTSEYWPTNYDLLETIYKVLPENKIEFPYQKLDVTVKSV